MTTIQHQWTPCMHAPHQDRGRLIIRDPQGNDYMGGYDARTESFVIKTPNEPAKKIHRSRAGWIWREREG